MLIPHLGHVLKSLFKRTFSAIVPRKNAEFYKERASFPKNEHIPGLRISTLKGWEQMLPKHIGIFLLTQNLASGNL